jgi:hypothetical protein
MAACGAAGLWALAQPPAVQAGTLAAAALAYVALAMIIDAAWRRHARDPEGDARAH